MTTTNFDYDRLLKNANAKIIVAFSSQSSVPSAAEGSTTPVQRSNSVEGFVTDRLSIGGAADFNNPLESARQQSADQLLQNIQVGVRGFAGRLGVDTESIPQLSLKSVAQSISVWTSSQRPSFTIPLAFIATRVDHDVRVEVQKLLSTVYPSFSESGTILPPLGYGSSLGVEGSLPTAKNTTTISIGRWFRASQQIIKNVEFSFSSEVHSNNTPLYATGTITFEPFRTVSAQEVAEYISVGSVNSVQAAVIQPTTVVDVGDIG